VGWTPMAHANKIPYFLKKFVKIRQALEVPPPDPSWLPAARSSASRPPPQCDLTHAYCTATKRFTFVALFNEIKVLRRKF